MINYKLITDYLNISTDAYEIRTDNVNDKETKKTTSSMTSFYDYSSNLIYSISIKDELTNFLCHITTSLNNIDKFKNSKLNFDVETINDYLTLGKIIFKIDYSNHYVKKKILVQKKTLVQKYTNNIIIKEFMIHTKPPSNTLLQEHMTNSLIDNVNLLLTHHNLTYSKENFDYILKVLNIIYY